MSQKASPTAIGAFVLGAVALIITGLLTFGSGKLLKDIDTFVLFFEGNAKGLNIGAPVSFRGVRIGDVNAVKLIYDTSTDGVYVAVTVEIMPDQFYEIQSQTGVDLSAGKVPLKHLIEDLGLRAKLAMLSLVTGQLYIEFDFYPDSPAQLYGFDFPYEELPTLPSTMEELQGALQTLVKSIRGLSIQKLVDQLVATVEGINKLVTSRHLQNTPEILNKALMEVRDLAENLNQQLTPLANSMRYTSDQAGGVMDDLRIALRREDSEKIVRLAQSIESAAMESRKLLARTDELVSGVDVSALETLVQELSAAARSIRVFAEYLERHPEALIRGKQ